MGKYTLPDLLFDAFIGGILVGATIVATPIILAASLCAMVSRE